MPEVEDKPLETTAPPAVVPDAPLVQPSEKSHDNDKMEVESEEPVVEPKDNKNDGEIIEVNEDEKKKDDQIKEDELKDSKINEDEKTKENINCDSKIQEDEKIKENINCDTDVNKKKTNRICANTSCTTTSADLIVAPYHCTIYFGLHTQKKKRHYICKECLHLGEQYREKCISALYSSEPIINVPIKNEDETVVLVDDETGSASSIESESDDEIMVALTDKEISTLTNELIVKTNLQSQTHACKKSLTDDLTKLVAGYDDLDERISALEREVDAARTLYSTSRDTMSHLQNSRTMRFKAISIDTDGKETYETEEDSSTTSNQATVPKNLRRSNNGTKVANEAQSTETTGSSSNNQDSKKIITETTNSDVQLVSRVTVPLPHKQTFLFETPKTIPKIMPKVGDTVYAMKKTSLFGWSLGTVQEILKNPNAKPTFKIKFEVKKRGKASIEETAHAFKELTAKQLAYNIPCPFILPVGTRIIGLFKDDCAIDEGVAPQESLYYAGIVAEPPKNPNNFRYLVFFDDGYAQYVQPTEVLLVCESSDPVWIDVHPDSQEFIRKYIEKYPERPMVRLTKGTVLSTEWSGQWWLSRVVELDCSLAKMHFQSDNRYEWIYRGSTRLSPLYDSQKRLDERSNKNAAERVSSRSLPRSNRAQNKFAIEYLYGNEDIFQKSKVKPVARKSTAPIQEKRESTTVVMKAGGRNAKSVPATSFAEFEGKLQRVTFPQGLPQPQEYAHHICNLKCAIPYNPQGLVRPQKDKPINPLNFPFHFGWAREIAKTPRRQIFYRTPCGRRLRDFAELHKYLVDTGFSLSIDHFCFDQNVDCQIEFVPSKVLFNIKDITYGKEEVPVQCINSLDHDYPAYVEYTRNRVQGKGIPLELDENFLVCCDCTDDCQDKRKCACWNLTYECYKKTREVTDIDVIGYSYRTLKEHQVSGIYECNPKCKCRKTCLNRVAQNPMKWLLQVFKTSNRGWAIRPLHDIPEGAFICVYAGQLLTEHLANEDGTKFGDEYLAELDFIEICEKYKDGYEAECQDPEEMEVEEPSKKQRKTYDDKASNNDGLDADDDSSDGCGRIRRQPSRFNPKVNESASKRKIDPELTTRDYFNKGEQCYIMDAKSIGNIGRYLNHCCSPNVYVQNVFVDTHDLRFPWVAFFAYKTIRAGTEMTWDYNYEIDSVPGRTLYCQCGSPECRGRLL